MIKKLLFATILATFSVLSTMAQNAPYDIFIGTTNNLHFGWAKNRLSGPAAPNCKDANGDCIDKTTGTCQLVNGNPQNCDINGAPLDDNDGPRAGFFWNNTLDSVGAITSAGPYEGADHMEFNYNTADWWASGAFNFNPGYAKVPTKDFSGYTHLKLFWKGFSAGNPRNKFNFQLSDTAGNYGPNVLVADSSNQATYVQKNVALKSFLGLSDDGKKTLSSLSTMMGLGYSVSDGNNTWWMTGGATEGVFYIDAIQLLDWLAVDAGGTSVFHSDTVDFGTTPQGTATATTTFTIENVGDSVLTLSGSPKITVSGDAADFAIVQSAMTSPLSPSSSTTFTVTFDPATIGTKAAILSIENNYSPTGHFDIVLVGRTPDLLPEISVKAGSTPVASAGSFKFDTTDIGANSALTFTITNLGNADLNLTGTPKITLSGDADFTVNETATISPVPATTGNTTTFIVTFTPTTAAAKSAVITIDNNDADEGSYVINLTGVGKTAATGLFGSNKKSGSDTYAAYPTPFTDETVIKVNSTVKAPMSIKVMDTKGTVISTSEGHFTNEDIALGKGLERGIYFVQTIYQDKIQVIKIVKI
jgi:hypothetical protein